MQKPIIFFDCDSTLTRIEGLDHLAKKKKISTDIKKITKLGMEGKISFFESFSRRISLLSPTESEANWIGEEYIKNISPGVSDSIKHLFDSGIEVYIVSGGLETALRIFGKYLGLSENNIFGIKIRFSSNGTFYEFDKKSLFLKKMGKQKIVSRIIEKRIDKNNLFKVFCGDGITDIETCKIMNKFIFYDGAVKRNIKRRLPVNSYVINDFYSFPKLIDEIFQEMYPSAK